MSEISRQYPIGKFQVPQQVTRQDRDRWIETIASTPVRFREAALSLSTSELDTPYREGGWTARQVIHHVPESHMNAYIRFKLALTENDPVVKPYDEAAWARLADVAVAPIEVSLQLLEALHERWVVLMRGMSDSDWQRRFIHPEYGQARTLEQTLALYAWHAEHHLGHVRSVKG